MASDICLALTTGVGLWPHLVEADERRREAEAASAAAAAAADAAAAAEGEEGEGKEDVDGKEDDKVGTDG